MTPIFCTAFRYHVQILKSGQGHLLSSCKAVLVNLSGIKIDPDCYHIGKLERLIIDLPEIYLNKSKDKIRLSL